MYLYGASGHAKVIIEILEALGITVNGLLDDNPNIKELLGYTCYNPKLFIASKDELIISIGDNNARRKISEKFDFRYGQAIHPLAAISTRAKVGEGSVIMPNATVNSGALIGKHAIINTSASIDHDCIIGDYTHISPNATLCGGVLIGEGTHFGASAVAIPGVKIGHWATIGAGSVIIRDVPDNAVVVGNPGRLILFPEQSF